MARRRVTLIASGAATLAALDEPFVVFADDESPVDAPQMGYFGPARLVSVYYERRGEEVVWVGKWLVHRLRDERVDVLPRRDRPTGRSV